MTSIFTMNARRVALAAVVCGGCLVPGGSWASPASDVQISINQGNVLTTNESLYANAFGGVLGDFVIDEPGFYGALPTGKDYSVLVLGKLWYHSGIVGDPVSTVSGNPYVQISSGTAGSFDLYQSSAAAASLPLAQDLDESLHKHLVFSLFPNSGTPAAAGVYGITMQVTSPDYGSSAPFLIALANLNNAPEQMTIEGVEYGEQAIFAQAVPEPTGLAIAGLGIGVAALAAVRRRLFRGS